MNQKNMIKLLKPYIDGTVLNEKCEFTQKIKELFQKLTKNNVRVVLATGRMFMGADPVRKQLGLETPVVCYQGAMVRRGNEILYQSSVEHNLAKELIQISRAKNFHLNLYNDDVLIVEDDNKRFMEDYTNGRHTTYKVANSFDEVQLGVVSKLLAIIYDENLLLDLQKEMQKKFENRLCVVRSHKYYLEFTNINASKGSALNFLADYWNIKKEEIMASGDQDNDYDMLKNAGIKIAMGNASEKLKSIADFICPPVEKDGLSAAIEKYLGDFL
ncbi:MAG: HAD family hydrolase [Candidatus Gastranaerophilales bacterium]|nr:HAD family hydrolase [Candidatus Gastranaerophilales bacterium]